MCLKPYLLLKASNIVYFVFGEPTKPSEDDKNCHVIFSRVIHLVIAFNQKCISVKSSDRSMT